MLIFLFAVASPFASLFRLAFLVYEYFVVPPASRGGGGGGGGLFASDILSNNVTETFHGLVQAIMANDNVRNDKQHQELTSLLLRYFGSAGVAGSTGVGEVLSRNNDLATELVRLETIHDLQLVIPWLFALFMLFVAPFACSMIRGANLGMYGVYPGEYAANIDRRKKLQRKVRRLISCLDSYQMELMEKDFQIMTNEDQNNKNCNQDDVQEGCEDHKPSSSPSTTLTRETKIIVPKSGRIHSNHVHVAKIPPDTSEPDVNTSSSSSCASMLNPQSSSTILATGTCAICLSTYEKGDTVVWSSNEECTHVFHKHCFVSWIEKKCSADCPCCRRPFIDHGVYLERKKSKSKTKTD